MTSSRSRVLVLDHDASGRDVLGRLLREAGFEPQEVADAAQALMAFQSDPAEMILINVHTLGIDGMAILRHAQRPNGHPLAVVSRLPQTATQEQPRECPLSPVDHDDVARSIHTAMFDRRPQRTSPVRSDQPPDSDLLQKIMGSGAAISRTYADVARVAACDFTVLIVGETGSGKELVARAIHQSSRRATGPLVDVDCGAIPETLFESELFGHEKGAFTGADSTRAGKFEIAKGGTLFLDEISSMPLGSQAKLLRALQERRVFRVGGTQSIPIDCRVVAATNEDLRAAFAQGSFRKDLFFRLNEFTIRVSPLRERREDIRELAIWFLHVTNRELLKNVQGFSERAMERLVDFDWPGNVRELQSTVRRAVLLADTVIDLEHLDLHENADLLGADCDDPWGAEAEAPLKEQLRWATAAVERAALARALKRCNGNKAQAARLLQIDYKTLYNKLKEYGFGSNGSGPLPEDDDGRRRGGGGFAGTGGARYGG